MNWRSTLYHAGVGAIIVCVTGCSGLTQSITPTSGSALSAGGTFQPFAKTYKIVSFSPNLPYPYAGLMQASSGAIYGAAFGGSGCSGCELYGGVYQFASGKIRPIYTFLGAPDGQNPQAGLTEGSQGILYGTTVYGGNACAGSTTCGTVYDLVPSGSTFKENVIYRFKGGSDGIGPVGGLYIDKTGALYGMTVFGGSTACTNGCGVVYRITGHGKHFHESVVYSFKGAPDGANPRGRLVADSGGALYGTTLYGGTGTCGSNTCGTIIKLTPSGSGYAESVVHNFKGKPNDGSNSRATLLPAGKGTFYGATLSGGTYNYGTIYKLTCSKKLCKETPIHSFTGSDGAFPHDDDGLISDASGNLYGTTTNSATGYGTVFTFDPTTGQLTTLHNFAGGPSDGTTPETAPLLINGYLYGTTFEGGSGACTLGSATGCGTLYIQKT